MEIIDVEELANPDETKVVEMAKIHHGYAHFGNSKWTTYVIHEISESTGYVIRTAVRAMAPAILNGELKWVAIPDPGNKLVVNKGPWVEPRGWTTFSSGAEVGVRRGCQPQNSAFIGAMACLAADYKLMKEDGSEYTIKEAGDVFSWAIYNTQAARAILHKQYENQRVQDAEKALQHASEMAELYSKTVEAFTEPIALKIASAGCLSPVLLVPQYTRAMRALIASGYPVAYCRKNFRPLTGVWIQGQSGQAEKQVILDAYAAIRAY